MLGLSKDFIIVTLVAGFFWIGSKDYMWFVWIMGIYIVLKIIWRFLTR
jgi:hypothetical protein